MGKEFGSFRKATFGGFNRKDVINYIEKMRNESFEYKKQVDETVKNLNEKIRELENAARLMESSAPAETELPVEETVTENYGDIGVATKHLKTVADELCRSLGDFIDKLSEKGLFDNTSEAEYEAGETESVAVEEELSLVDGILSSISYLGGIAEKEGVKESRTEEVSVSELLSGFSFTK